MTDTAIATVIAAGIAGLVGWLTARSAKQGQTAAAQAAATAAVASQNVSSRADLERDAFERAKGFYTDTLDRQDRMIATRDQRIAELEVQVATVKESAHRLEERVEHLETELATAHAALRLKYPDES